MKVCIVGGGASGIYCAIALKRKEPSTDVFIIEKEDRLGRKICATGNGKCNLLNDSFNKSHFSNSEKIEEYLKQFPAEELVSILDSWGVPTYEKNNYRYPLSNSAPTHVKNLQRILEDLGVRLLLNTKFVDYKTCNNKVLVYTEDTNYEVDKLIIACGGKSSPNLGSDGSIYSILSNNHDYNLTTLSPGLVPVKVKETHYTKSLKGFRHDATVSLYLNKNNKLKKVYEEDGELLFKKDALSGIVIFNVESVMARIGLNNKFVIGIDLFKNIKLLPKSLQNPHKTKDIDLIPYFPENVSRTLLTYAKNTKLSLEEVIHDMRFTCNGVYDFKNSQVTVGGIDVNYVDENLESTIEPNVFLTGEILDFDGICGGFNLTWCLISALVVSRQIIK